MTLRPKRKAAITAAELMAELAEDESFQQAAAARERQVQAQAEVHRLSEQPIVADLQAAGLRVGSVWDLVNTVEPYPDALPVLMMHLERGGYTARVMESLGRALAVAEAVRYWTVLRERFSRAPDPDQVEGEATGLAVALAVCATPAEFKDVVALIEDESRGSSRIHLLGAALRTGGSAGREIISRLQDDVTLGKEARALLR